MKLTLKSEHLAALTDDDLAGVAGGVYTIVGLTCPLVACVTGTNTQTQLTCPGGCRLPSFSVDVC